FFASHLLDGYTITDWTYSADPWGVVWALRSDGKLLSLTYVPGLSVWAWALHETEGTVMALAAVPEDDEDAVYLMVERDGVRNLERFATRRISDIRTGICLD